MVNGTLNKELVMNVSRVLYAALMGATVTLGVGILAPTAQADTTYTLNVGNTAISGFPAPYGSVDVHLVDATHATVTFDAATTGGFQYLFGGQGAAAVNVSGSFIPTTGSLTGSNPLGGGPGSGFANNPADLSFAGAGSEDGFGNFNLTVDSFDGYGHSFLEIVFGITATSGNTWASSAAVLSATNPVAAHIFVAQCPAGTCGTDALATGYAAPGPIVGGGLPGVVMACGALLALGRRRRQRTV
jgi:hypothetical protein